MRASGALNDTTPEVDFREWLRRHQLQARYRPFDYLRAFLDRSPFFPELEATPDETVAEACLEVLDSAGELDELPIFFLQIEKSFTMAVGSPSLLW